MENKLHTKREKRKDLDFPKLSKLKFIRSSELVYVAYTKDLLQPKNKEILEAALYATKFKGSAISEDEIKKIEAMELESIGIAVGSVRFLTKFVALLLRVSFSSDVKTILKCLSLCGHLAIVLST